MTYTTTMTSKGQITIPKAFRELLNLKTSSKLTVIFDKKENAVLVKQNPDLLDIANTFKVKNKKNVLKAREAFEKKYERT